MIMVTHDVDEAIYLSDRVFVMTARPAKIQEVIKVDISRPRDRSLPEFIRLRSKILKILDFAGKEPEIFEWNDFIKEHPQLAKKLSEALFKGSQYVSEHKEEITKIQVDKKYCPGDAQTNAQIIQTYKYDPSIDGGKEALRNNIKDLQEIGLIKKDTDISALTENSFEDVSKN